MKDDYATLEKQRKKIKSDTNEIIKGGGKSEKQKKCML